MSQRTRKWTAGAALGRALICDGLPYVYDINALSNFVTAPTLVG